MIQRAGECDLKAGNSLCGSLSPAEYVQYRLLMESGIYTRAIHGAANQHSPASYLPDGTGAH